MLSAVKNMRLPNQVGLGVLLLITTIFIVLVIAINEVLSQKLNDIVTDHQLTEVSLVAHELETEHALIKESLTRASSMTNTMLSKSVTRNSSQVLINGQPIQKNDASLQSLKNIAQTDILLAQRDGNQYKLLSSSSSAFEQQFSLPTNLPSSGMITIEGLDYLTDIRPLATDDTLFVITLVSLDDILKDISEQLSGLTFGKSGYVYVADMGSNEGNLLVHPSVAGKNLYALFPALKSEFQKMFQSDNGVLYYTVKVDGQDSDARESKAIFQHVKGWNWVVAIKTYSSEYQAEINSILLVIAVIAAVGAILLSLAVWYFIRRALSPLREINAGLKEIGLGNLTYRFKKPVPKDSNNELHHLQHSIRGMRDDLQSLIIQVNESSQALHGAAHQINEANAHLMSSASSSTQSCVEVASAIEQISASTEEVASNSVEVSEESNSVSAATESGYQAVELVKNTVSNLSSSFERAAQTIEDVESSTSNIGAVVTVINDIAEQTNLLALNAAIEAARAGEQGRGFAVVADEVRVLAQRTQQSTEEIHKVVTRLQEGSRSAVSTMQEGRDQVELSVSQASDAGELLAQIRQSMVVVAEGIASVAASAEEQSVAATQIKGNANTLHQEAQSTLEEANNSQAQSIHIQELAQSLRNQLSKFTVS